MKIRNRHLVRAAGRLGSLSMRGLVRSLRYEYHCMAGRPNRPSDFGPDTPGRHIYSIWHENLLLPTIRCGHPTLSVLISKHADGQILGSLIEAMGMGMVQGSTNRGGIEAVRKLIHDPEARRHLAVTPDGPRGPRRVVQPGLVYVASRAGMSVVCTGVGYHRPWRMGSWDRFAVPKPCSRAKLITGVPIVVPPGLKAAELETYRLRIQAEMDRLNAIAERWADTNRLVIDPPAEPLPLRRAS